MTAADASEQAKANTARMTSQRHMHGAEPPYNSRKGAKYVKVSYGCRADGLAEGSRGQISSIMLLQNPAMYMKDVPLC